MSDHLTPIVHLLDSFDLCNGFILAMTLYVVGSFSSQSDIEMQKSANKKATGLFLLLLLCSLLRDGTLFSLLTRLVQTGMLAWMAASILKIVLSASTALRGTMERQLQNSRAKTYLGKKQSRLQLRQARIREARRLRQEAEWEAGREDREVAAEAAKRQTQAEADQKREEQERREIARFEVRLLFDRHAADIRTSMPRRRLDEYIETDLSDKYPAETVEQRAEQMKQTILDFFESQEPETQLTTEAIEAHYEAELDRVTNLDLDDHSKAAMRSELHFAWERARRTRKIR